VIGSVAARFHGLEVEPRDLDVTPDLDPLNLSRLITALADAEAWPVPKAGHWERDAAGERVWYADPDSPSEIRAWVPDPKRPETLDSLFTSRLGDLDVVPDLSGTFQRLDERATPRRAGAIEARVAHLDDLIAALTVPRRARDAERVRALRERQRTALGRGP
jgi:hypothetical protein